VAVRAPVVEKGEEAEGKGALLELASARQRRGGGLVPLQPLRPHQPLGRTTVCQRHTRGRNWGCRKGCSWGCRCPCLSQGRKRLLCTPLEALALAPGLSVSAPCAPLAPSSLPLASSLFVASSEPLACSPSPSPSPFCSPPFLHPLLACPFSPTLRPPAPVPAPPPPSPPPRLVLPSAGPATLSAPVSAGPDCASLWVAAPTVAAAASAAGQAAAVEALARPRVRHSYRVGCSRGHCPTWHYPTWHSRSWSC